MKSNIILTRSINLVKAVTIIFLLTYFPIAKGEQWVLYDDFSGGSIDLSKWNIQNGNGARGTLAVENGRLVIRHFHTSIDESIWLSITQNTDVIRGIKAEVKVLDCDGRIRGRLAGNMGEGFTPERELFAATQLDPWFQNANGFISVDKHDINTGEFLSFIRDEFYGEMNSNSPLWNKMRILATRWNTDAEFVTMKSTGLGYIQRVFPYDVKPSTRSFVALGTRRSNHGNSIATCSVEFDNVLVRMP